MALTGLDIYKLLPKTNCGDCGSPTCLAFAMRMAQKKAELEECPHVSEEAKAALAGASAPPMRLVKIGHDDHQIEIGNETIMFRHESTFLHECAIAIETDPGDETPLAEQAKQIAGLTFERVGQQIGINLIAIPDDSGDPAKYADAVKTVTDACALTPMLMTTNPECMAAALKVCADRKPLLASATADNAEAMAALAKENGCTLVVAADDLEALAALTEKVKAAGCEDMIVDPGVRETGAVIERLTEQRRHALKKNFRPLGYPSIAYAAADDPAEQLLQASAYIAKYAGVVVTELREPWQVLPLLTMRQNIYTDPQKPIQVEPKLYEIGNVTDESPLLVTTNFSLTYFTVEGDVEASRVPSYILVVDTEGTSVLTAYAAEKFTAEGIAQALANVGDRVKHHKIIIPGHVSVMSGKLEDESGWEVLVGPRESSGIPSYLKTVWKP
ncbi:acetyl-CoA decarbonylase/synthase complex subunit gamma [candidate division KD3-62 bacterium DG_56]|uniref:Acetyl-CoA decarbonylase/synthase complex subunit gamma n=1 Tax=candidate division KD3-62 bacterium DG_56 TaxID=1704032 RepID=A0A0S7XMN2_9BACT|nr:MAG: acetyl-CoA decarbonylase/synthase complex subunit gamma [candidate division KD3-62 bacterium DG_56]